MERRSEIGLRCSLGSTRGQIRPQFLVEALLVSGLGGVAGVVAGLYPAARAARVSPTEALAG